MSFPVYPEYKNSGIEWVGKIPAHWNTKKFRYSFYESSEKIEDAMVGDMLSVSGYRGVEIKLYDDENKKRREEDLIGYRIVRKGQLVVNTMWLNYSGLGISDYQGHVSPAYRAYWVSKEFNKRYVHHMMRSESFVRGYTSFLTGIRPNSLQMSRDDLMAFPILLPPLEEQIAIAAFLDRETGKIDALIAEQEKLLTLLAEKRQATISHAATRGLNSNAPMKNSGIPWIDGVPEHWEVISLNLLSIDKCDGPFGSGIKSDHYTDCGAMVIRLQNIKHGIFNIGVPVFLSQEYFENSLTGHSVIERDVLIAGLGDGNNLLGRACVAPPGLGSALVKADCFRFRLDESRAFPLFIARQLSAGAAYDAGILSTGTTRSRIPLGAMSKRKIVLPPISEQKEISLFLDQKISVFVGLEEQVYRIISLLKERRSALISAAVTGKIDVRNAVPKGKAA